MKTSDNAHAEFYHKLQRALEEVAAAGIWASHYDPPIYRLMRRFGLRLRPPHYASPSRFGLGLAIYFALAWGVFMQIFAWPALTMANVASAALAGAFFGICMTAIMAYGRRKHRLSRWEDL